MKKELTPEQIENIRKDPDKQDWNDLSRDYKLLEDFIIEFQYLVNWKCISISQKLSEDFIKKFAYYVDWDYISKYQVLSENFIREYKNKLNWYCILIYQKLSEEFFLEFESKLLDKDYFKECCRNKNFNNIKHYLRHGIKFNNKLRKSLL
ncbi:hypothetical protein KY334_03410 [Candidatus Woesearchaeota archaeon]|nr:hypothetical protein [Candidatus Woesearchaeota archaeon]